MNSSSNRRVRPERPLPRRAVVDIGSNTVRLVIYGGPLRAPITLWNEKVAPQLGKALSGTGGAIPEEAMEEAIAAIARYRHIVEDLGIEQVDVVATAAARDATNGPEFMRRAAETGFDVRLLDGPEEARLSAMGAIAAFRDARGTVADLGGGSLELIAIGDGECKDGVSLPLGTLRLSALRKKAHFRRRVVELLAKEGWSGAHDGPLYMIGGTWRAFAACAMRARKYPLTDPHSFEMSVEEANELAAKLVRSKPAKLVEVRGVSPMRAEKLPDAAALLQVLLKELGPSKLVFSSWGLREGLIYDRLDPLDKARDPLIAAISAFASQRYATITDATLLAAWTADMAHGDGETSERLRLAAGQLAIALHRVEPNLRLNYATEWALDKRWIWLDARGRAMICAALFGSLGRTALPDALRELAGDDDLREAVGWGLAFRLARQLGASSKVSLTTSALRAKKKNLVLRLDKSRAALATWPVERDLEMLADWLGLTPKIKTGDFQFDEPDDEPEIG
ncbi:Ppx/GppA family phosphatase [Qipengyuania sp. MTN3-11]|uniref:Ppx/GppA phosphatase family protein n=1 Tax=Qipengyuania sp. MTN3-11 TaxID=3056557 RepID=UPI0036F43F8C